ncbi:MAG: SAM-dependent methyltransferase [Oscillospiraceae bacterium]|nr:SAM-dependent methyltransferase [Oscillospiraceae bacterium]MCL2278481.1 SAM-dependent methyltransferase [Oscillospiraceae bacterium]
MHQEILDKIINLSKNVNKKLPKSFELHYYSKHEYSGVHRTLKLDNRLLIESICYEIAYIHVIVYMLSKCIGIHTNYTGLIKFFDSDGFFSWFVPDEPISFSVDEGAGIECIINLLNKHDCFLDRGVKKVFGQFYTPPLIVKKMLISIDEKLKKLKPEEKIVDPACGSGVILAETVRKLCELWDFAEVLDFVNSNLHGYDVNPFAVIATKVNVFCVLLLCSKNELNRKHLVKMLKDESLCFKYVQLRNTVTEKIDSKFSIILGNPPFFKMNTNSTKNLTGYKHIVYGQPNIYSFFMYWGVSHLSDEGTMCFIVPQSIRSGLYFKNLRSKFRDLRISSIKSIQPRVNVFYGAEQAVLIICMEMKKILNSKTQIQFYDKADSIVSDFKIKRAKIMMGENNNYTFVIAKNIKMYDIIDKVYANGALLKDEQSGEKFSNGLFVWNQHKEILVDSASEGIPVIYGGNIQLALFNYQSKLANPERKQYARIVNKTKPLIMRGRKLLIQRTTNFDRAFRFKACIMSEEFLDNYAIYYLENHVNFLCSKVGRNELLPDSTLCFFLGMLNSKLINYLFSSISGNTQVSANELNSLPLNVRGSKSIADFVSVKKGNLLESRNELDRLVCELYNLTEQETEIVMNM